MYRKTIDAIIEKRNFGTAETSALAVLRDYQEQEGYIPEEAISYTAARLGEDEDRLRRQVSLFPVFRTDPVGKYTIRLCGGPSCRSRKTLAIRDAILDYLQLDETKSISTDGKFSLVQTGCAFKCSQGPVVYINDKPFYWMTPEKMLEIMKALP